MLNYIQEFQDNHHLANESYRFWSRKIKFRIYRKLELNNHFLIVLFIKFTCLISNTKTAN